MGLLFRLFDAGSCPTASSDNVSASPAAEPVRADPPAPLLTARYYPPAAPPWYNIRRPFFYGALPPAPPGGYGVFPPAGTVSPSYSLSAEIVR